MNKLIREFCASQNVDYRWQLLCQIESILKRSIKAVNLATLVGSVCILPFMVLTCMKIMWSIGFMTDPSESPIQHFLSEIGCFSWGAILGAFLAACLLASILVVTIYNVYLRSGAKEVLTELRGSDAYKAQQIVKKSKELTTKDIDEWGNGIVWLVLGGIILTSLTQCIDQSFSYGAPMWALPFLIILTAILAIIPLAIPVGLSGLLCSCFVSLPFHIMFDGIKLSALQQNADSEWVRLDEKEANCRKEAAIRAEQAEKAAQEARERSMSTHIPIPSYSSYSPEKGLNTFMTDRRNGQTVWFDHSGNYVNDDGERVPLQHIEE